MQKPHKDCPKSHGSASDSGKMFSHAVKQAGALLIHPPPWSLCGCFLGSLHERTVFRRSDSQFPLRAPHPALGAGRRHPDGGEPALAGSAAKGSSRHQASAAAGAPAACSASKAGARCSNGTSTSCHTPANGSARVRPRGWFAWGWSWLLSIRRALPTEIPAAAAATSWLLPPRRFAMNQVALVTR